MKSVSGRYIVGGVLVVLGLLFLLSNAGLLPLNWGIGGFWGFIGNWWPLILIAVGLIGLVSGGFRFRLWAVIQLLLGVGFLLSARGILEWAYLWPALIVLAGLFILLRRRGRRRERETVAVQPSRDEPAVIMPGNAPAVETAGIDGSAWRAVFGNVAERIAAPDFRGGAAEAVFGSVELDLRDAALADDAAHLTVSVTFGELKLRVPPHWIVHWHDVKVTLGDSVEQRQLPTPEQAAGELTITGAVTFGRLEITD